MAQANENPSWVEEAKHLIETGDREVLNAEINVARAETLFDDAKRTYYTALQDIFIKAKAADPKLSGRKIASLIGKSHVWVNGILAWKRGASTLPFEDAAEAAKKRAKREALLAEAGQREHQQPSQEAPQPKRSLSPTPEDLGQLCLLGGSSDYAPGQRDATVQAMGALATCREFTKMMRGITRQNLTLVFKSSGTDKQRPTLESLATELERSIAAAEVALDEVRATLDDVRPAPDFEESPSTIAEARVIVLSDHRKPLDHHLNSTTQ
jgi:hypothetical protein